MTQPLPSPGPGPALPAALAEIGSLVRLAVPLVIGLAASTLIGVTDTVMVAPLGTQALAGVGITTAVIVIFYAAVYGALSSFGVAVANAWGAGEERVIAALVRSGIRLGLTWGAVATVLFSLMWLALPHLGQPPEVLALMGPYWFSMAAMLVPFAVLLIFKQLFEAVDRPWTGVAFAFTGVVINVPLNYVLIHGIGPFPQLGLTGAGIASLISETLACLAAWLWWRAARSTRRLRVRGRPQPGTALALAREGAPLGIGYAAESGAMAVASLMLGLLGAVVLAANQVASSVGSLLYMVPLGMAGAVAIRIGQADGAGERWRLRPIGLAAMGAVTVWMLATATVLWFAGDDLARLITDEPEVARLAGAIFVVVALMQVADGLQSSALGALRGLHDTDFPSGLSLVTYWVISLPLAWLLAFPLGLGAVGLWSGFGAGLAIAAVILPVRFWRKTRPPPTP